MGIKRLGRKRLAAIEKLGILKDIGASDVMKKAIVSATQHREGQKVVTDVVLDLGASAAGLKVQATAEAFPLGTTTSAASYVCRVTDAVFGVVTSVDVVCLEDITDGTLTDFDVKYATGDAGDLDTEAATDVSIKEGVGSKGYHDLAEYDSEELKDKYIYITSGAASSAKATATIDCSGSTVANITDQVTTVILTADDGATEVIFKADNSVAWDASHTTDEIFGISGSAGSGGEMDTVAKLTRSLSYSINRNSNFSTDSDSQANVGDAGATAADGEITVTVANVNATSNNSNFLVDHPDSASGITVGNFSGGLPNAITGGKLLLRFTGFMDFDDL